ncbi:hypothetical protein FFI16_022915 [Pseudomonas sp. KBS0710]|uniref:hypothetical protein n=1 Tax=Pseudomonas sp. KBS0710 TaxID=1179667 RepID=UPI00110D8D7C|nr:hypothetical protein [Pseudomonas sp. KBS0710]TSD79163.1 hypothetical protein FFI16_022915 [Pseudomonas sp. KBS0710]
MRTTLEKERGTYSGAPEFPAEKSSDSTHDAHFFSAALEQNITYPQAPPVPGNSRSLVDQSERLKSNHEKIPKLLREYSKTRNELKMADATQSIIESKEILNIGVKVIKHCASFVEKATNLQ